MVDRISQSQRRALDMIRRWRDLSPDAEDEIGVAGAAMWAVMDSLVTRGLIVATSHGGFDLTARGRNALADATRLSMIECAPT